MMEQKEELELPPDIYERFHDQRIATASDGVPAMSDRAFVKTLLDTQEAAKNGYYSRDDELRELIEKWRGAAQDARESGRVGDAQVLGSCASELEGLLES